MSDEKRPTKSDPQEVDDQDETQAALRAVERATGEQLTSDRQNPPDKAGQNATKPRRDNL